jgi:sensor histidine kinase YesM
MEEITYFYSINNIFLDYPVRMRINRIMIFPAVIENVLSNRKRLFWIGNASFWLINLSGNLIVNSAAASSLTYYIIQFVLVAIAFFLVLPLRFIYKRYKWHKLNLIKAMILVVILSYILSGVWAYLIQVELFLFTGDIKTLNFGLSIFLKQSYYNAWPILLWSVLYLGYKVWEEWNEQKFQIEHERALLKTSQLEMLKYQLNPHFLFNTLSSLRGLINTEPAKAKEIVTHISEFLRYSLLEGKNNEVQLIKEIEIIKLYLSIEQIRYNEDLAVEFNISPETNDFMIPIFLMHPLVENAVKHGMQTSSLPLKIFINSSFTGHSILLEVINSGKWIEKGQNIKVNSTGLGLINIQKRLEHSFPDNHSFEIIKGMDSVKVVIIITNKRT